MKKNTHALLKPLVPVLLTLALASGCAGSRKSFEASEPKSENWAEQMAPREAKPAGDYRAILKLYSDGQYEEALSRLDQFERRYPKHPQLSQIYNLKGLVHLQKNRPLQAIQQFNRALQSSQNLRFSQFLRYNLAVAQYDAKLTDNSLETVKEIDADELDLSTRLKYLYLWAKLDQRLGVPAEAADKTLRASYILPAFGDDSSTMAETRKLLEAQLETSVNEAPDLAKLEDLYRDHQDAPLADALLYFSGRKAYRLGFAGVADSMIRNLTMRHPRSQYFADAQDILRTIQNQTKVDSRAIGVLLPMSGRFNKFAEHTLNAVELAFGIYAQERPNPDITLIVADSGSEGEESVRSLEKLYFEHNVVAVIGPLLSKKVPEVTQRAQELGVPLISLAQKSGSNGNFVFQIAVTARNEAYEIARHAIQKEGIKRFAIAFPQDPFGKEYSDAFWDAVEELGGSVVGVEAYDPQETDYRMIVDKLSGLHYLDARNTETRIQGQLREQLGITRRYWKTEPFYRLKPIIDYEAVFIPDTAKNVSQILPTFAYRDVENIRYLGISTWNAPRVIKGAKDYSGGSVFVDVFNSSSSAPEIVRFAEEFQATFGYAPTKIEALAFDAASLLRKALQVSGNDVSRKELRDLMTAFKNFPGVTGRISYDEGQFTRELKFFRIANGRVDEIKG